MKTRAVPGGVSFSWKVKLTLGVAEEGGPSGSVIFFFWKYHQNGGEKSAMN